LDLNNNRLTGVVPAALGHLAALKWLYLGGNQLTSVPAELLRGLSCVFLDDGVARVP
jgi:Leucine-rich repeat (LRR) protein